MIEQSKHYALAITCGAKRGPKDTDLTFSPSSLRDFLRALAEQPAQQQEPVAWKDRTYGNLHHQDFGNSIPLYTSPQPSKPWVGLTEQEENELWESTDSDWELMKRTEAKLREKNA